MLLKDEIICFLDIDGVLNGEECLDEKDFIKESIEVLNWMYREYGIKLVLSSSWREYYPVMYMQTLLKEKGILADLIDVTPIYLETSKVTPGKIELKEEEFKMHPYKDRNAEIIYYCRVHGVRRFVILDDTLFTLSVLSNHQV